MKALTPLLTLLACTGAASADVAFDNFGPGSTFSGSGWIVRGPNASPWWTHAFPFTPTVSGEITTVTVALNHLGGNTNNYTFDLRADAAGSPGAVLGALGQVAGFIGSSTPVQFTANAGTSITAGTMYWLYARGEDDAQGTWLSSLTPGGTRAYSFDGGTTFTVATLSPTDAQAAMRIEVTPGGNQCYANCDQSTAPPILNANDFQCFLNKFAAGCT